MDIPSVPNGREKVLCDPLFLHLTRFGEGEEREREIEEGILVAGEREREKDFHQFNTSKAWSR